MLKTMAAAAAILLAAVPALADEVPQYNGPIFANPLPPKEPETVWQVTLDDDDFLPKEGMAGTCQSYGSRHQPAREPFSQIAHFRVGDDEVWIYQVRDSDPTFHFAIAYTTSKETCEKIESGALPLVKPRGGAN
jgi:hypothetical protein